MTPVHLACLANGQDYHIHKWLPALAEEGLQVTLLSYLPPERLPGVRCLRLERPWRERPDDPIRYADFWRGARSVRSWLAANEVDALLASFATTYGWLGLRTGFRPLIVQTWSRDVTQVPWVGWKRHVFRPLVRRVLGAADAITTDGEAYADLVRTRFPDVRDRVLSTTWGIRQADYEVSDVARKEARRELGLPEDVPVCTSGRGVRSWYRPEVVLPAIESALERNPRLHVIVLTLAHERTAEVQAALDRLGGHPRVRLFDRFLDPREMRAVWGASDLAISIPQFDGVSEGLLEAMLAGAVPVVSDIPTNRHLMGEGSRGIIVSGGSIDELRNGILATIENLAHLRETLVPANRAWVRTHASVEATARQVAELVHSLCRMRRNAPSKNTAS